MSIFKRRKSNRFIDLLIKQAEFTVQGLELLLEYVKDPQESLAQELTRIEKDADEVRRILIDELNRTFVTPIDREDIFSLSLTVDDVLDYAETTVEEMHMLRVQSNPFLSPDGLLAHRRCARTAQGDPPSGGSSFRCQ